MNKFNTRSAHSEDRVTLWLEGEVTLETTGTLRDAITEAHRESQRVHAKELIIDFTQLDFLNSSGIKHLVTWVNSVVQLPPEQRYQVRLRSNPLIPWQRRSLTTLKYFAPDLVMIESVTPAP